MHTQFQRKCLPPKIMLKLQINLPFFLLLLLMLFLMFSFFFRRRYLSALVRFIILLTKLIGARSTLFRFSQLPMPKTNLFKFIRANCFHK